MTRRLTTAALGLAPAAALCGCWNRILVEDEHGEADRIRLPRGYRYVGPTIQQTESNISVTITFERTK